MAREAIVAKLLEKYEFGNNIPAKSYRDLTSNELSRITESIVQRLYLFEGSFPAFLPQAVKAIMEHPNMSQSDQQKMDTFSKMFELDWRGDRSVTNKREFMSLNPVYLNTKD